MALVLDGVNRARVPLMTEYKYEKTGFANKTSVVAPMISEEYFNLQRVSAADIQLAIQSGKMAKLLCSAI